MAERKDRLHPMILTPEQAERAARDKPKGARLTPPQDLQLQNFPEEEEPRVKYPRWDLLLEYWNEVQE